MAMKVCPACNARVEEDSDTCRACDHDFDVSDSAGTLAKETVMGVPSLDDGGGADGAKAMKVCPSCNARVKEDAETCGVCDHDFDVSDSAGTLAKETVMGVPSLDDGGGADGANSVFSDLTGDRKEVTSAKDETASTAVVGSSKPAFDRNEIGAGLKDQNEKSAPDSDEQGNEEPTQDSQEGGSDRGEMEQQPEDPSARTQTDHSYQVGLLAVVFFGLIATCFVSAGILGGLGNLLFKEEPRLDPDCTMNGLGNGDCHFTNTTDRTANACGRIIAFCDTLDTGTKRSSTFCSGDVEPRRSEKVSFSVAGFDRITPRFSDWRDSCDFYWVAAD